jgi:hypothetical protein
MNKQNIVPSGDDTVLCLHYTPAFVNYHQQLGNMPFQTFQPVNIWSNYKGVQGGEREDRSKWQTLEMF